jgi:hypothetical protein
MGYTNVGSIASASHFSKSARSGAPTVIFGYCQKNKRALYFVVKLAHLPVGECEPTISSGTKSAG